MNVKQKWTLIGCIIAIALMRGLDYAPEAFGVSKPQTVVVVRESADTIKLTKEQIAYLGDPKIRTDAKAVGIQMLVLDPDIQDATNKTPEQFVKAIELAKQKGLPRLIFIGVRGGVTAYVLPATEADFRKRLGI